MLLTFGLGDDMADPQSLAHIMKGLVPRIAPLINIIIWAGPQHVVHSIITGTCKQHSSLRGCATTSVHIFPHGIAKEQRARISPSADSHSSTPKELCNNTLNWNWEKKSLNLICSFAQFLCENEQVIKYMVCSNRFLWTTSKKDLDGFHEKFRTPGTGNTVESTEVNPFHLD